MSTYYPWYSQRAKVKKIVIKSGVTNIGDYAFTRLLQPHINHYPKYRD